MKRTLIILFLYFLVHTASAQNFIWAKNIGSHCTAAATGSAGGVYTTGNFTGVIDFDPGAGTTTLGVGSNNQNLFISHTDAAGNFVAAYAILVTGGAGYITPYSIKTDAADNMYITGNYITSTLSVIDFDPGPGTYTLSSLSSQAVAFVLKLDAGGNFIWVKSLEGNNGNSLGSAIELDGSGNLLVGGYYTGNIDFDPGITTNTSATSPSIYNSFVLKLDGAGNFVWVKEFAGTGNIYLNTLCKDAMGNIDVAGRYAATADMDPGVASYSLSSAGGDDIFVVKLDNTGNFTWAKSIGGTGNNYATSVKADAYGNVHLTGASGGTTDYDPGIGTYTLSSSAPTDIFILKLDATGNFTWVKTIGSSSSAPQLKTAGLSIDLDPSGNVYTTGTASGSQPVDFDPGPGSYLLSMNTASWCSFISELDASGNFIWAGTMGGGEGTGIHLFNYDVYESGYFYPNSADIDPTIGTYPLPGFNDGFILKLSGAPQISGPVLFCNNNGTATGSYSVVDAPGNTYSWTVFPGVITGAINSQSVNAIFSSGTSTLSVTISNSLTSVTRSVVVTVGPPPALSVTALPSLSVCVGSSITLNATGADAYYWSSSYWNGPVTNNVPFQVAASENYTVTGAMANGCVSNTTVAVTAYSLPILAINALPSAMVCSGSTLALNAYTFFVTTYTWSSNVVNNVPFTVTTSAVYTLSGTGANGCVNSITYSITAIPGPVTSFSVSPSATVCAGTAITLSGNGALSYGWSGNVIDNVSFVPLASTVYTVTGTGFNLCTGTATVAVQVNSLPTVSAVVLPSPAVCAGSTISLAATGAATYTWTNDPGNNISFTPLASAIYSVTGTSTAGCVNTGTVISFVNALPLVGITVLPSPTVCAGGTLNLSGTGASVYNWSGGITNNVTFTTASNAVYTVTGTDINNCVNTKTVNIQVKPLPAVGISVLPSATVCAGSTLNLSGTGASVYSWSGGIANNVTFTAMATTVYTVTGTGQNNCVNTKTVSIQVDALPAVGISVLPSATVCTGSTLTLSGTGATTYSWTNAISNGINFTVTTSAIYTVTGSDSNGCINTAIVSILANPLPVMAYSAVPSLSICAGKSMTLTASGASTYTWSNGISNGVSFTPTASTTYSLSGTTINGCTGSISVPVVVNPQATVLLQPLSQTVMVGANTQFMTNSSGQLSTFQWQEDNGSGFVNLSNTNQYAGVTTATLGVSGVVVLQDGYLFRCVVSENTCTDTSSNAMLTVLKTTGIATLRNLYSFKVYPIPAKDRFSIEISGGFSGQRYELVDQTGRVLLSGALDDKKTEVDISGYARGLYFVNIPNTSLKPVKVVKE